MGGNLTASGLHAIGQGLRRLHDTEVSLASLSEVLAGWWRRLVRSSAALLDALTPRFLLTDDRHLRIAISAPDHAHLILRHNNTIIADTPIEPDHLLSLALQQRLPGTGRATSAIISVSDGAALLKSIPVSATVRGRKLVKALDYMLELESPFPRSQVLWAHRCRSEPRQGQKIVELVIVPRTVVDPVINTLNSNAVHVREIQYQASLGPDDAIRIAAFPTPAARRQRYLCMVLGILVFLGIGALASVPFAANVIRSERLAAKTEQLGRTASELAGMRTELEETLKPIGTAIADLQALPRPVAVLHMLQKELGPDVVLDRLSLRGRSIQLSGTAGNLAGMVDRIEKSSNLKPRSVTSNGKAGAQQHERFTLTLELSANP